MICSGFAGDEDVWGDDYENENGEDIFIFRAGLAIPLLAGDAEEKNGGAAAGA